MQKLKKFAAVTLALMLIVTLAVSVSAEPVSGKTGSKTIDVNARYTSGALTPKVYSVDVTWGKMEFTYSVSGTREWNPETHEYADKTSAGWKAEGNDVTVVNHSNIPRTRCRKDKKGRGCPLIFLRLWCVMRLCKDGTGTDRAILSVRRRGR